MSTEYVCSPLPENVVKQFGSKISRRVICQSILKLAKAMGLELRGDQICKAGTDDCESLRNWVKTNIAELEYINHVSVYGETVENRIRKLSITARRQKKTNSCWAVNGLIMQHYTKDSDNPEAVNEEEEMAALVPPVTKQALYNALNYKGITAKNVPSWWISKAWSQKEKDDAAKDFQDKIDNLLIQYVYTNKMPDYKNAVQSVAAGAPIPGDVEANEMNGLLQYLVEQFGNKVEERKIDSAYAQLQDSDLTNRIKKKRIMENVGILFSGLWDGQNISFDLKMNYTARLGILLLYYCNLGLQYDRFIPWLTLLNIHHPIMVDVNNGNRFYSTDTVLPKTISQLTPQSLAIMLRKSPMILGIDVGVLASNPSSMNDVCGHVVIVYDIYFDPESSQTMVRLLDTGYNGLNEQVDKFAYQVLKMKAPTIKEQAIAYGFLTVDENITPVNGGQVNTYGNNSIPVNFLTIPYQLLIQSMERSMAAAHNQNNNVPADLVIYGYSVDNFDSYVVKKK